MNTAGKIGFYGAVLALAFPGAYDIGGAADPLTTTPTPHTVRQESSTMNDDEHSASIPPLPGGLQVPQDGYTLDLLTPA